MVYLHPDTTPHPARHCCGWRRGVPLSQSKLSDQPHELMGAIVRLANALTTTWVAKHRPDPPSPPSPTSPTQPSQPTQTSRWERPGKMKCAGRQKDDEGVLTGTKIVTQTTNCLQWIVQWILTYVCVFTPSVTSGFFCHHDDVRLGNSSVPL